MSVKLYKGHTTALTEDVKIPASNTIVKDTILAIDTTNNGYIPATSSSTTVTIRWVAQEALTSSGSVSKVLATRILPGQIWLMDCTANTASNQEGLRHALTDAGAVNNTSSTVAGNTGVVEMISVWGAAADKKALFLVHSLGAPTA